MKKTLLCFLFLFPILIYSQITKLEACQNYPEFNLTSKYSELIGNLNPSQTTVSFHLSLEDANNNVNQIPNPSRYGSGPKTIYARINNNGTISTNFFELSFFLPFQILYTKTSVNCYQPKSQITIVGTGGKAPYSYSIDLGQTYSPSNRLFLDPGTYTILIKDSQNCQPTNYPLQIEIESFNLSATATIAEGTQCGDKDVVTITGNGGVTPYTYSFDGENYSNSNTSTELKAGDHNVYVKDQNGCTASTTIKVNQYKSSLSSIATSTPITCKDKGSITIVTQGGKAPYQYAVNGTPYVPNQTSNYVLNNLEAGSYTITTKDDANCVFTQTVELKSYQYLTAIVNAKSLSCFGSSDGEVEIIAQGGILPYKYSLKNTSGNLIKSPQSFNIFKDLISGIYDVEITDAANCTLNLQIEMREPDVIDITANIVNQTVTINATGGTGKYLYSLDSFERGTSNVFTDVSFGNHEIYVLDENGCVTIQYIIVHPPAPLLNGQTEIVLEFKSGQTLGDIVLEGENITWYATSGSSITGKSARKAAESPLPLTTILVNGVTYYASQTINRIESTKRLAVTAKLNGSLSTPDFNSVDFQFYPNPVKHILNIKNKSEIDSIEIFSVAGKSVLSKKLNSTQAQIDLSLLPSGLYLLNIKSDGKEKTTKFIKE